MTPEELVNELEDCVRTGLYFEITLPETQTLLEYIRELESATADSRHVG